MVLEMVSRVRRYQGQCRALQPLGHQGYRLRSYKKELPLDSGYIGSLGLPFAAAAATDDRYGTGDAMMARHPFCPTAWLWVGLAKPCDLLLHSFLCFISGLCMSCFTALSYPSLFTPYWFPNLKGRGSLQKNVLFLCQDGSFRILARGWFLPSTPYEYRLPCFRFGVACD